jgi:hypothetical protein
MMIEMAIPVPDRHKLPQATPPDLERLHQLCDEHGIKILGPLPI